jgi:hypothetical protein
MFLQAGSLGNSAVEQADTSNAVVLGVCNEELTAIVAHSNAARLKECCAVRWAAVPGKTLDPASRNNTHGTRLKIKTHHAMGGRVCQIHVLSSRGYVNDLGIAGRWWRKAVDQW